MSERTCPQCGAELPSQATICPRCQTPVEPFFAAQESIKCPHCERFVSGEHAFCPFCGSSLRTAEEGAPTAPTSIVAQVEIDPERLRRIRERKDLWGAHGAQQGAQGQAMGGNAASVPAGPPPLEEGAASPGVAAVVPSPTVATAVAAAARGRLGGAYQRDGRTRVRPTAPLAASGLMAGAGWLILSIVFVAVRPGLARLPMVAPAGMLSDLVVVMAAMAWMLLGAGIGALVASGSPKNHRTAAKAGASLGALMGLAVGAITFLIWKAGATEGAIVKMPAVVTMAGVSVVWSIVKGALVGLLTFTIFRAIFKEEAAAYIA